MKTRGRRTLLCARLQKQICRYLTNCCTIRTACEATGISETAFFSWIRRGEAGEQPFAKFAQAIARARGRAKARIVRSLLDEKDWRPRLELLARVFPDEYGRREIVPQVEQERKPTFVKVVLNINGKTLEEITNFPIVDDLALRVQNEAKSQPADASNTHVPQRVPVVGIGGKVVRWRDATDEQDATDADADLP